MKLGVYIMASESVLAAYFINASHHSVCIYIDSRIIARQWLGKTVVGALDTQTTK
jgi:hypothetical protein